MNAIGQTPLTYQNTAQPKDNGTNPAVVHSRVANAGGNRNVHPQGPSDGEPVMTRMLLAEKRMELTSGNGTAVETRENPMTTPADHPKMIAERLEWVRRYVGKSQKEFAESIGVLPTTYSNWRRGSQSLSLDGARRIKRCYQISLDFLFFGDPSNLPDQIRKAWEARAFA